MYYASEYMVREGRKIQLKVLSYRNSIEDVKKDIENIETVNLIEILKII